jgi:hypothetical protein
MSLPFGRPDARASGVATSLSFPTSPDWRGGSNAAPFFPRA